MNTPALSPRLSMKQISALLYDQQEHYADDQVMNFLSPSFEDMADLILTAEKNCKDAQEEADWTGREIPGFGDLRGQLDALTVYARAA